RRWVGGEGVGRVGRRGLGHPRHGPLRAHRQRPEHRRASGHARSRRRRRRPALARRSTALARGRLPRAHRRRPRGRAMSPRRVGAVVHKEIREFRRNRFVIGTMAVLPIVFVITPVVAIFKTPESASASQVRAAFGVISLLLLVVPVVLPPVIAAYSVVGERDQGTLEPVLTTPVRASELLLGKAVATFLPSVGLAYAIYLLILI